MFFKLLILGIIAGAGVYYYDLSSSQVVLKEAVFSSLETENRCKNNHETMCKYYMTIKLGSGGRDQKFYKFRVPWQYFHIKNQDNGLKGTKYRVEYKEKKILPARILGLEPKFQEKLSKQIEEQNKK